MLKKIIVAWSFLFLAAHAEAKIVTKKIDYKDGETQLQGYLAYNDSLKKDVPAVLLVHDWMGLGENTERRAEQLAKEGYVAFAADIYGKGIRPKNSDEAAKMATDYKSHRDILRQRIIAAYNTLKEQAHVNKSKLAAIGYCFGGTTVLELARSGADLKGTITFHGGLSTPTPQDAKNIKGKVLALHGADDPFVNKDEVAAFEDEMRKGGVDWELVKYGGAVHSFTIVEAGNDNSKGAAYNKKADERSWVAMNEFFKEIF